MANASQLAALTVALEIRFVCPVNVVLKRKNAGRVRYSKRCAEASAVQAYQKRGFSLVPGMEIGYVVTDAAKWQVDTERDASEFDAGYYEKLLDKAWEEVEFVFKNGN